VLLAHLVPDDVVVGKLSPPPAHLGGVAQRSRVKRAKDLEAQLSGECAEEVDLDEVADGRGDEGELGEAALGEDALQHEVAVSRGGGREERPNVGDALLVNLRFLLEFLRPSVAVT
jgi:hypothetical protein